MECNTYQSKTDVFDWCTCVWANMTCTQKSDTSLKILRSRRKVQNLHHLGVNSSLTSTQGTEANRKDMLWNSSSFGLISSPTHSLSVTKISIRRGGEGWWLFPFPGQKPADSALSSIHTSTLLAPFPRSGFLLFLLFLFFASFPTTRWRRVFCSGNSVCRTHCWLSEVLWLFPRSLGASGPTAGGFYRPSGLGTGSGSREGMLKKIR